MLAVIMDHAYDGKSVAHPGIPRIAAHASISERSTKRAIVALEAGSYLAVDRRGRCNRYTILFDRVTGAASGPNEAPDDPTDEATSGTNRNATEATSDATGAKADLTGAKSTMGLGPPMASEAVKALKPLLETGFEAGQAAHAPGAMDTKEQAMQEHELPRWLSRDAWSRWQARRGAGYTADQQKADQRLLLRLVEQGHLATALIDLAIACNWRSFNGRDSTLANPRLPGESLADCSNRLSTRTIGQDGKVIASSGEARHQGGSRRAPQPCGPDPESFRKKAERLRHDRDVLGVISAEECARQLAELNAEWQELSKPSLVVAA